MRSRVSFPLRNSVVPLWNRGILCAMGRRVLDLVLIGVVFAGCAQNPQPISSTQWSGPEWYQDPRTGELRLVPSRRAL